MNEPFPPSGAPPETTVDVWLVDLDRPLDDDANLREMLTVILSIEERKRAERLALAGDAARFRLCRAMLRMGLGWYLQQSPRDVKLTLGSRGKPRLGGGGRLHFNVSHSGSLGAIAFTVVGEVGIDLEPFERDVEALEIASSHFTAREAGEVAAAGTPQEQRRAFLRLWTRKEAVLKAAGHGIQLGLNTVDVSKESGSLVRLRGAPGEVSESQWQVSSIDGIEGFAASVAAPVGVWSIRLWPIRAEDAILRFAAAFPGLW